MNNVNIKKKYLEIQDEISKFPIIEGTDWIDYSSVDWVTGIEFFVWHEDEFLLLKRSDKVGNHRNLWSNIAGYMQLGVPLERLMCVELEEETGIKEEHIVNDSCEMIDYCELIVDGTGKDYGPNTVWRHFLGTLELSSKPDVELDWEHSEHRWLKPSQLDEIRHEMCPYLGVFLEMDLAQKQTR
jgi:8-oxo-dGTP pyrophosphatase MutT (NUDIX family)